VAFFRDAYPHPIRQHVRDVGRGDHFADSMASSLPKLAKA
jgi:hypothetical protein